MASQGLCFLPIQFVIYYVSRFWNNIFIYNNRDRFRTPTTSEMGFFMTLVDNRKLLSNVTKSFILDVAGALDIPWNNVKKQSWRAILTFTCTLIFLGKKYRTEVEGFKLVCLEKLVPETALAALSNLCGDKIKISNEYWNYWWYGLQS